jgi:hypothetical protein
VRAPQVYRAIHAPLLWCYNAARIKGGLTIDCGLSDRVGGGDGDGFGDGGDSTAAALTPQPRLRPRPRPQLAAADTGVRPQ